MGAKAETDTRRTRDRVYPSAHHEIIDEDSVVFDWNSEVEALRTLGLLRPHRRLRLGGWSVVGG